MSDLSDVRTQVLRQKNASEFAQEQRTDPSLQIAWTRADRGSDEFQVKDGLLYKRTNYDANTNEEFALVVPSKF